MKQKVLEGIENGESETVEFKSSFDKDTIETLVADVFKAAGLIEKYGSGIKRILNVFKVYGLPAPEFEETSGGFMVTTYKKTGVVPPQVTPQVTPQVDAILRVASEEAVSSSLLQQSAGLKDRVHFLKMYLMPLVECGWLERTIPDKPRSRLQKYRLTAEGKKVLEKLKK